MDIRFKFMWSRYPRRFSGSHMDYPQVLELILSVSSLWWEYSAAEASHIVPFFAPPGSHEVLLSGQRRCGFKAWPWLLYITSAAGTESQAWSWVQHLIKSATCSMSHEPCYSTKIPINQWRNKCMVYVYHLLTFRHNIYYIKVHKATVRIYKYDYL